MAQNHLNGTPVIEAPQSPQFNPSVTLPDRPEKSEVVKSDSTNPNSQEQTEKKTRKRKTETKDGESSKRVCENDDFDTRAEIIREKEALLRDKAEFLNEREVVKTT